ncbi:hypothetical protein QE152_g1270 [Popillia japonica]|uniref:Uncharacterized protein n=1 Tax=Popillia japonica TaxID=7064 RepID=A0AAW1NB66_POPJA
MELSKERALGKKSVNEPSVNEPSLDSKRERVTACSITRSFCHIGSDWRDILRPHYRIGLAGYSPASLPMNTGVFAVTFML